MLTDPCREQSPPELAVAIQEFNQGLFFECHEILERLWMAEPRPIRRLYQGILQIGVGFHHLRNARYHPVCTLLVRGSGYLQPFAPACMGIDVEQLLTAAARCLAEVERLGSEKLDQFDWSLIPKLEMSSHIDREKE
jgi:predicted metal-dependent hydrolase